MSGLLDKINAGHIDTITDEDIKEIVANIFNISYSFKI